MNKYVIYKSPAYAREKSHVKAYDMGCDGCEVCPDTGKILYTAGTSLWWGVVELSDGRGALEIPERDWRVPVVEESVVVEGELAPVAVPWVDPLSAWQRNNLVDEAVVAELLPREEGVFDAL